MRYCLLYIIVKTALLDEFNGIKVIVQFVLEKYEISPAGVLKLFY